MPGGPCRRKAPRRFRRECQLTLLAKTVDSYVPVADRGPTNLRLRKPPIVEAYIRFDMTARDAERPFSLEEVQAFVSGYCPQYSPKETRVTRNVTVKWPQSGQSANVEFSQRFERIRAWVVSYQDRDLCV